MRNRYSTRQLILAKCAVVAVVAVLVGARLAHKPSEAPRTILVLLALMGAMVAAYEALSHGIAVLLARSGRGLRLTPVEGGPEGSPDRRALRRRDVVTALVVFLLAQALVWTVAGVSAAMRAGKGGDHSDLLQALIRLVPVALPGSLIAGGVALLLVLRSWRQRLGADALRNILGLSPAGPRQIITGVLGGAALALCILPLMSLVANRPEPPDLITQLAGASTSTLQAWMISAVLLAPPIEELMFRGVMLGGLAQTWTIRGAALVSGTTFWLMHGPEFVHWPAAVAIGLLTILATWLRVRSRSLGPSIAAHFGYNLVLATVMSLALLAKPSGTRWARDHHPQRIEWAGFGWPSRLRQGEG